MRSPATTEEARTISIGYHTSHTPHTERPCRAGIARARPRNKSSNLRFESARKISGCRIYVLLSLGRKASEDRQDELAASLLAQGLFLLAVLLALLLALLRNLRRILIALLFLDLALPIVNECFAIAQPAGFLALCQLRRLVLLALFRDAALVGVLVLARGR